MTFIPLAALTALVLVLAYKTYGTWLARAFELDRSAPMPSETLRDDVDFVPTEARFLLGQHFSAIAAAGPIVGPILAGAMFGWAPALLWIIFGSILIGGVHDFTALLASTRHRGRGITEIVREYMSNRSYILFLIFVWLALVYIIVAFTDITAQSFVGSQTLENGEVVTGAGIASASLMYIALPVLMGLSLRYTRIGLWPATAIFLPMVLLAIYLGQLFPIDLASILGVSETAAHKFWDVGILLYCLVAAVCPVWLLLQPRGHLGGFFLYFFILAGISGMVFGDREVLYPAFIGFHSAKGDGLIPVLFITIACGAVSGFHSLIASGTTSKQLKYETDVKSVGYGTMLLEAGVAFIALSCVMALPLGAPILASSPNLVFANGIASSLELVGVPPGLAISIMLMAFTTFVYDTLDICTRLGRYIIQELSGRPDWKGRWLGTSLTALVPLVFVTQTLTDPQGKVIPAWRVFWPLFGASNQLLAALTLLGVSVWVWKTRRKVSLCLVTLLPCVFMYLMSCWALCVMVMSAYRSPAGSSAVIAIGSVLLVVAAVMLVEGMAIFGASLWSGSGSDRTGAPLSY